MVASVSVGIIVKAQIGGVHVDCHADVDLRQRFLQNLT